jgi:hypothetical protein
MFNRRSCSWSPKKFLKKMADKIVNHFQIYFSIRLLLSSYTCHHQLLLQEIINFCVEVDA